MARTVSTGMGLAIIVGAVFLIGYCANHGGGSGTDAKPAAAVKVDPAVAKQNSRDRTMQEMEASTKVLADLKVGAIESQSMAGVNIVLSVFNSTAGTLRDLTRIDDLTADEKGKARALRKLLVQRQREAFPPMRRAAAKEMDQKLWEADVDVSAIGNRSSILSFVGAYFAANKNIAETSKTFSPTMARLRFTQNRYRWYSGAGEYQYYDLKNPKDDAIAIIDASGNVDPVDLQRLDAK